MELIGAGRVPEVGLSGLEHELLHRLPSGVILVGPDGEVLFANQAAAKLGALSRGELAVDRLRLLARRAARGSGALDEHLVLPLPPEPPLRRPRTDRQPPAVRVRAVPVGPAGQVALLIDDVSEARRVDEVRRDFVANISHELKTPVGALHLLAEAILEASDDPEAVRRFAGRMSHESSRLARIVQELIDLSRLQGADPLPAAQPVEVSAVVTEALDRTRLAAQMKEITVVVTGRQDEVALGDEAQLVTAVANLVDNAVAYSPERTRVVVGIRHREPGWLEISVADEGIGISELDVERIFERFYRVDPARSRATGGTGLGLAIVKHIASNHGGGVSVWSAEEIGSTFTLRLPAMDPRVPTAPAPQPDWRKTP
jgi:two-component system, OmpR family, sensor histidine kinase SenX3